MQKVIVIAGPTASGKSALAVELARESDGEVISADSRQVYRGLDIGTGKIMPDEMQGIPHHLLDIADPTDAFTAARFAEAGRAAIEGIAGRGKLPIICGGTGFYIDALLGRAALPEVEPDPALRDELSRRSAPELYAQLQELDPARAAAIDRNNPARLIRAIEVATALGAVPPLPRPSPRYDALWIGIAWPDDALRQRIRTRLLARLDAGMIDEAKRLHAAGLSFARMRELGLEYRALADLLEGRVSEDAFIETLATKIRQYARSQMKYWKRNLAIQWVRGADPLPQAEALVREFLAKK
ncbi:MAG TPA: tRNA (adenosine(37)-N6)-dimethylallyltransferase MiaA [Candidatus Paceibacterota bacterium]|nr:tRNA (adenosine(37)-N6)-dimethylallyltransferase MiaA [Candidatus Paceibacterota bacterium]